MRDRLHIDILKVLLIMNGFFVQYHVIIIYYSSKNEKNDMKTSKVIWNSVFYHIIKYFRWILHFIIVNQIALNHIKKVLKWDHYDYYVIWKYLPEIFYKMVEHTI
jgi:hypothetical protein